MKVPQNLTGRLGKVKRGWRRSQRGVVSRIKKTTDAAVVTVHLSSSTTVLQIVSGRFPNVSVTRGFLHIFQWLICSRSARPHFVLGHSKCVSRAFNVAEHGVAH